jgi:hypothetical protein
VRLSARTWHHCCVHHIASPIARVRAALRAAATTVEVVPYSKPVTADNKAFVDSSDGACVMCFVVASVIDMFAESNSSSDSSDAHG